MPRQCAVPGCRNSAGKDGTSPLLYGVPAAGFLSCIVVVGFQLSDCRYRIRYNCRLFRDVSVWD